MEVFAQNGLRTITDQVFPNAGADKMALFAEGGTAQLKSLTVTPLEKAMFLPGKEVPTRRLTCPPRVGAEGTAHGIAPDAIPSARPYPGGRNISVLTWLQQVS